jgi:P22 coat protein - gene protein 5
MPNSILTPQIIADKMVAGFMVESAYAQYMNTDYTERFRKADIKVGESMDVRLPVQGTIRDGAAISIQDVVEPKGTLRAEPEFGIDFAFSDFDLTLKIEEFDKRYIKPFAARIAAEFDLRCARKLMAQTSLQVGTPGTPPATADIALQAGEMLTNQACPTSDPRQFSLTPRANRSLITGLAGFFNSQSTLAKNFDTGVLQDSLGFTPHMTSNFPVHTVGPLGGAPVVAGTVPGLLPAGPTENPWGSFTDVSVSGFTAAVGLRLNAGDIIEFSGVNDVHPLMGQNLGYAKQFVVVSPVTSDAAGNAVIRVSPAIIAGGAYRTVSARPALGAAITVRSGAAGAVVPQNIMFHRDAMAVGTVRLEPVGGADMGTKFVGGNGSATGDYGGFSIRFVRTYDVNLNRRISRLDMLAFYGTLRQNWAVRVPQ